MRTRTLGNIFTDNEWIEAKYAVCQIFGLQFWQKFLSRNVSDDIYLPLFNEKYCQIFTVNNRFYQSRKLTYYFDVSFCKKFLSL